MKSPSATFAAVASLAFALFAPAALAQTVQPAHCPKATEELPELLASSMQRIGREAEVQAEFEVDAKGRVQPLTVDGNRRYRGAVRTALYSMNCHGGTPQRYVVSIRFAEPTAASASALAAAAPRVSMANSR
ncbi:hypothetical protein [Pelomonas sp. SE-A7]|uniref:hypothetical protein n=1 Tax=Pelomonas sp. SE-A7 TaxID=3054953 RepID=UPI00259CE4CC|nr:hypothetical protein [Pelomonas sp. SE-A7]MDM4766488.1 hypothetical protein [Pelomonas sp. SE-A7]